ncbi:MAG: hypothetical protein FJZ90_08160 [Chloroflexi bacterium]|nr:hypothetical protein [Chloroflexota bacterium]
MPARREAADGATTGPLKGDFIAPPEVQERDEREDALPAQEEFWRPPVRFGSVPVEKEPPSAGTAAEATASCTPR